MWRTRYARSLPPHRDYLDILSNLLYLIFTSYTIFPAPCTKMVRPRITHAAAIHEIILSHADERRCKRNFPRKLRGWSWIYYAVELQGIGNEDPYIALVSSLAPIELMASIALIPSHSLQSCPSFFPLPITYSSLFPL